jgi:hypothetical protein
MTIIAAPLSALIAYDAVRFSEARDQVRHQLARAAVAD